MPLDIDVHSIMMSTVQLMRYDHERISNHAMWPSYAHQQADFVASTFIMLLNNEGCRCYMLSMPVLR